MLNSFVMNSTKNIESDVMSMVMGCEKFLDRHTGDVPDGATPEEMSQYLINSQGMVSNDLHYLDVGGNGTPSGTSTTETQSIHILGHIYMYKATGHEYFLEKAKYYWQAYFDTFYLGQTVPNIPKEFRCHWMVNSKQPFLSAYPINWEMTSHSGWKGVEFNAVNNEIIVPDDTTYFGSQLQKCTYAFRASDILVWDSIEARVTEPTWEAPGHVYEIEWFINYQGHKVNPAGNRVDNTDYPVSERGKIKLSGTVRLESDDGKILETGKVFNEVVKLNFCTANGEEIGRNEPFDPRPLWTPLKKGWQGNASDAEQWFGDACYQMWEITGEEKYNIMHKCVVETCKGYADIDRGQMFWRKNPNIVTPYTDGISYIYSNYEDIPDKNKLFYRDDISGLNVLDLEKVPEDADGDREVVIEQQAVWYKLNDETEMVLEGEASEVFDQKVTFSVNKIKTDDDSISKQTWFRLNTDKFTTSLTKKHYKLAHALIIDSDSYFCKKKDASVYSGSTIPGISLYDIAGEDILGNVHDNYLDATFTNYPESTEPSSYEGFWHNLTKYGTTTTYTTFKQITLQIINGLANMPEAATWTITLTDSSDVDKTATITYDKSNGQWVTLTCQELFGVDELPNIKAMTVDLDSALDYATHGAYKVKINLYAVNDIPETFSPSKHGEYLIMHRVTSSTTDSKFLTVSFGDIFLDKYSDDNLAYTPGMIPFSNNFNPDTQQYDSWQGMPYMGYQYGWVWKDDPTYWHNVKRVLYDSQKSYPSRHKWSDGSPVIGPCSSAYVWNRWDNTGYGPIDTFVDTFWGTDKPWDGYQPRAMLAIGRMYEHAAKHPTDGIKVDAELTEMCNTWVDFLYQFQLDNGGKFPDYYPKDVPDSGDLSYPANKWGFVGHMVGNYLTAACKMAVGGLDNERLVPLIRALYADIHKNYFVGDAGFHMNGCWSENPTGGEFFGFWAGDIYKALGSYLIFEKWIRGNNG